MKVTGYKLREALRRWQLRRDTAAGQFDKSLMAFEGEDKPKPEAIADAVLKAEAAIALLQTAQTRYNIMVGVEVADVGRLTLLGCVKLIGGLARVEKLWRNAAGTEKKGRSIYDLVHGRDKDQLVAKRTVSFDEAAKLAEGIGRQLAALRVAIATGNAAEVPIEDLDATLFE